jgi:hypothetical protein
MGSDRLQKERGYTIEDLLGGGSILFKLKKKCTLNAGNCVCGRMDGNKFALWG